MTECLCKLLQKPYIALEEQLDVVYAVLQNCDPIHTHSKGEACDLFGIIVVVFHELEDIGIHHATAENFDPAGLLAGTTGFEITLTAAATDKATHQHFGAGLREWKK